jgi:hypothetical protein
MMQNQNPMVNNLLEGRGILISNSKNNFQQIKDFSVQINIDCHRRVLEEKGLFKKPLKEQVWDNFDIFEISEIIAKGLKAGGFTHIQEFRIDKNYIYAVTSRSRGKKINDAIKLFADESELRKRYKVFKYKAALFKNGDSAISTVLIQRQHAVDTPNISIKIKGELTRDQCVTILKNFKKHIAIKTMETKPVISY